MTVLEFLDRRAERRAEMKRARIAAAAAKPGFWERVLPTDFRGWLGLALFVQSTLLFMILGAVRQLNENQGFMTLAAAVIVTGWVGGAAAFAYSAGKGNSEQRDLTDRALRVAENAQATGNGNGDGSGDGTALKAGDTVELNKAPEVEA